MSNSRKTRRAKERADKKAWFKAIHWAEENGCKICGELFEFGDGPGQLVRLGPEMFVAHAKCVPQAAELIGITQNFADHDYHADADRIWFERHPDRRILLRRPYSRGELELFMARLRIAVAGRSELGGMDRVRMVASLLRQHEHDAWVLVHQIKEGVRTRAPLLLPSFGINPARLSDDEITSLLSACGVRTAIAPRSMSELRALGIQAISSVDAQIHQFEALAEAIGANRKAGVEGEY